MNATIPFLPRIYLIIWTISKNPFSVIWTLRRTDIKDAGNEYLLEAELPGFSKQDIHIDLNGNRLEISAKHEEAKEEKKENYVCRERKFGSFSRSFDVTGIDTSGISAGYQDGILTLHLPKKQPVKPEAKRIELN